MKFGTVSPQDDHSHSPGSNDTDLWQESWALHFFDAKRRIGGYYHIGRQVPRGKADIWNWTSFEGRLIDSSQDIHLPLPPDDFSDIHVGPFHLVSTVPNKERRLIVQSGAFSAEFQYTAIHEPISFLHIGDESYSELAAGHYETIGRITGIIRWNGRELAVDGHAYDDRSWGSRDWRSMTNHRYIWAYFGPDLYMVLYHIRTKKGVQQWGWVFDNGKRHMIDRVDIDVLMSSDGITARAVDVVAWTDGGFAYHLTGRCETQNVVTQRDTFMSSPATCQFEMGGRIGPGILEISELKSYQPWLREELGPA
jgi:hypothetical protein